ncbi:MAG: secretin N-terminal domain-containing protein [Candidatus Babeliales bacterium]|jgi:general secretion pathway protein D
MTGHKQILVGFFFMVSAVAHGMLLDSDVDSAALEKKIRSVEKKRSVAGTSSELVEFSYQQKNLKDLLNEFAQKLNINILYPETEVITTTVTFDAGRKVTMTEAWDFVTMICEQAGCTLVLRGNGIYTLISNMKSFAEPLPLYIGIDYMQLPDTSERIRFIYYFNNIQVKKQQTELLAILNNILPVLPTPDANKQLVLDQNTNSMILTTKSEMVKSVMQLVTILDESGFREAVEVLKIEHAKSDEVVAVLKNVIGGGDATKKPDMSLSGTPRARYFSEYVKVENLDPKEARRKLNFIVIMGKMEDVEEIKKFIKKYLDLPLESGKSFFHVVDLQWLNAAKFQTVLSAFVKGDTSGTGQSTSSAVSDLGFEPHIKIEAENISGGTPQGSTLATATNSGGPSPIATTAIQQGGNRLVIACSSRDWERIESLIKQLDIPQKQVIIEAIVMDLDLLFTRKLGAQLRTRGLDPAIFPKYMQAQAGLLINNIVGNDFPGTSSTSYNLLGDLSDILNPAGIAGTGGLDVLATPSVLPSGAVAGDSLNAPKAFNGSTMFMINGGKERTNGVWAFFQLLSSHGSSKVFTRPVIMALNNQPASVLSSITKNLPDTVSNGTSPTVNYKQMVAPVSINFTPLISDNDSVSLQIQTSLVTWLAPDNTTEGTRSKRILNTTVSMKSGDVLILGGLIKEDIDVTKRSVPFFENIPVIGNLFTSRSKTGHATQMYILIRPTVVIPRTQGGAGPITRSAGNFMVDQIADSEEAFGSLKDPITRWFFNSDKAQSASELLEEKLEELPTFDLGQSNFDAPIKNTTARKPERFGGDMKVGWFSDASSNSKFASRAAVDGRIDSLTNFLRDLENPFEAGLQAQERLQV